MDGYTHVPTNIDRHSEMGTCVCVLWVDGWVGVRARACVRACVFVNTHMCIQMCYHRLYVDDIHVFIHVYNRCVATHHLRATCMYINTCVQQYTCIYMCIISRVYISTTLCV